jgi:hypothetical protein
VVAALVAALPLFLTIALFSRFPLRKFPLDGFIGEEFADFWQQAARQYVDFLLRDFCLLIVRLYGFALPCLLVRCSQSLCGCCLSFSYLLFRLISRF